MCCRREKTGLPGGMCVRNTVSSVELGSARQKSTGTSLKAHEPTERNVRFSFEAQSDEQCSQTLLAGKEAEAQWIQG